ncbi:MAG: hypothetical protein ACI9XU_000089 [Arenicella sp.]|jgi:hypothetical protein
MNRINVTSSFKIFCLMVVLGFLSGCAADIAHDPGNPCIDGVCIPHGPGIPGGIGGPVNPGPGSGTTKTVNISYTNIGGIDCPSAATTEQGAPGDDIEFVGVMGKKYWISFDPFLGAKHPSGGNGKVTLRLNKNSLLPLADNPAGQQYHFKYTILAKDCPPLDPMVIIDR